VIQVFPYLRTTVETTSDSVVERIQQRVLTEYLVEHLNTPSVKDELRTRFSDAVHKAVPDVEDAE
jgi:hypothetical protein